MHEAGVEWNAVGWRGLVAPKDTPPQVLTTLQQATSRIVASPEYAEFMRKNGFAIEVRVGAEFSEFLSAQDTQWRDVISAAGYAR